MTSADREAAAHEGFVFVGGCACLDFVATLGRRHAHPVERVPDPTALSQWFVDEGLLSDLSDVSTEDLLESRRLREAIFTLVQGSMNATAPDTDALGVVDAFAAGPDLPPRLEAGPDGRLVTVPGMGTPAQALATIARDAVRLLGGAKATRIKQCEHPDCSLLFLDETQSGRRRWCSMDRCGNLVKVRSYRARRAKPRAPVAQ